MNDSSSRTLPNVLAGILGGVVVAVVGALLISTNVIDTGSKTTTVREAAPSAAAAKPVADDGSSRTVSDIYKREGKGVVFIQSTGVSSDSSSPFGDSSGGTATGSGFVVDKDGTILTNAHVVEGADKVQVRENENGDFVDAKVAGTDESSDLAVLKVDPDKIDAQPLPLGDSSKVTVGDAVIAIGNPFGLTRTVTTGIASALQRNIDAPNGFSIPNVIQTDASINPGNSGGPLLDSSGRVIGINSQIATGGSSSEGSVGIGFAVPINTAKKALPDLESGETIKRSYLGITMAPVTSDSAKSLKLATEHGALVRAVTNGGPADKAGLRGARSANGAGGDLIVKVDGKAVRTPDDVASAIADDAVGKQIEVEYYRGKSLKTAKVKLGERPKQAQQQSDQSQGGGQLPDIPNIP